MLYLDCETHLIRPGRVAPTVVCVTVAQDSADPEILLKSPETVSRLRAWLERETIVGHNVAFDLACIGQQWPGLLPLVWRAYDEDRVLDTKIFAQLRDIATVGHLRFKYSLASLSERLLGRFLAKGEDTWRLRYADLDGMPLSSWPESAKTYALDDVIVTRDVFRELRAGGYPATFAEQCRADFALHLARAFGLWTDRAVVEDTKGDLVLMQTRAKPVLLEAGILRANGTIDQAALRARAAKAGVVATTAKGSIKVSADVLADVSDSVLCAYRDYKSAEKLLSTYIPVVETNGSIHPRYNVLVESGRTSCAEPNIQNLPRAGGIRECFTAAPGVFVAADYHIAELVCLAQVLLSWVGPKSKLADELRSGRDLHLATAAAILKIDYESCAERYRAGDGEVKRARQLAKGLSFGIPGGLGVAKLAKLLHNYGIEVSDAEARTLKSQWLAAYPEMHLYFRMMSTLGAGFKLAHPITGYERAGLNFCSGANHLFQHLCAFGAKRAVYRVQRACFHDDVFRGCRLVAFVHDELIVWCPNVERVHEVGEALSRIMIEAFREVCPDVPIEASAHAMPRWYKDATASFGDDGRLQPWSPESRRS